MADVKIPRCMSTQHPDNASPPSFAGGSVLEGEDEVMEAYYAFKTLGCDEQMWDHEGKEVDEFVVQKLLTRYPEYFRERRLGADVFLTLRVPNPAHQQADGKVLLEVLESIPRFYDVARLFSPDSPPPVFEVILPMTTNALELNRIWHYYRRFVAAKSGVSLFPNDIPLKQWIGEFLPESIHVIPLIEEKEAMLRADKIVEEYVQGKGEPYQRVFLARSDPALTYGSVSAVLLLKIALAGLARLEEKIGLPIYPIIGVGSAPFRGNFKPTNVQNCLRGYPSVQTFSVQSAFKFDYPEESVAKAVAAVKAAPRRAPLELVDEARVRALIEKIAARYAERIEALSPVINAVAAHVPSRRKRKLHVGLFGYARSLGSHALPRAITFCAALYSLGLPPEILGLDGLSADDLAFIRRVYPDFDEDLADALEFLDPEALLLLPADARASTNKLIGSLQRQAQAHPEHLKLARFIRFCIHEGETAYLPDLIARAARIRRFLG